MAPDTPRPDVVRAAVDDTVRSEVVALADAAEAADGARPLSEDAELALRSARAVHLLLRLADGTLAGYAQLPAEPGGGGEAVVHPGHRRRGLGRALLRAARDAADGPAVLWSHGDQPDARGLAAELGWARTRTLWQMHRPLGGDPLPAAPPPDGVRLRPFRPGEDDAAWLALNAAAFADHPEQGRWTQQDLDARLGEPWFDAEGFLLAEDTADGALLGFHWTKTHPGAAGTPPAGEVYVLGVHPDAQGRGLGRALTLAGLAHLAGRGLTRVLLYVEADNDAGVRTYRSLGFEVASSDVQYSSPEPGRDGAG